MEAKLVLVVVAFACALVGGTVLASALLGVLLKRLRDQRLIERSGAGDSLFATMIRRGIPGLRRPADVVLKLSVVREFVQEIENALAYKGLRSSSRALVTLLMAGSFVIAITASALSSSLVCGAMLASCFVLGVGVWTNRQHDERRTQLREAIPEALQSMKACFQVGYTLSQVVYEVRRSTSGPLADLFQEVEGVLETGGSTEEALSVLKKRTSESELVFLATALEIQHKTGSSMQQVLEVTRQSVADEIELKRTLKTQTAQAKLSAQIVTIMPFALIGIFSLLSPGFLDPFFESMLGAVLLFVALSMQCAGIVMVRRFLRVEVA